MTIRGLVDDTETYRWRLDWSWSSAAAGLAVFIGCNPRHRGDQYDPTAGFCFRQVKDRVDRLALVNLFGLRTPNPSGLLGATDPVGPDNDRHLCQAVADADFVVACWGDDGARLNQQRADWVASQIDGLLCLGMYKAGNPYHPLAASRLKEDLQLSNPKGRRL